MLRFRTKNETGGSTIELNSTEEKILALMGAANASIGNQNLQINPVEVSAFLYTLLQLVFLKKLKIVKISKRLLENFYLHIF